MIRPAKRLRRSLATAIAAMLTVSTLAVGPATAVPGGPLPKGATERRLVPPARTESTVQGLDPALAEVAATAARKGAAAARALGKRQGLTFRDDDVAVLVQADPGAAGDAEKSIAEVQGRVTGRAGDALRVTLSPAALTVLAGSPGVLRVGRPSRPRPLAVRSEGVTMTNADRFQALGNDGTGVKVGIIDVGFDRYQEYQALGYLPDASLLTTAVFDSMPYGVHFDGSMDDGAGGRTSPLPHGSAVAETVHDVAPGAHLYLAAIGDSVDLDAAVEWMHGNGVEVISMSLGWIGMPLDSGRSSGADNTVNLAVNKAVGTYKMFWANAAGNFRLNHWRGDFYDREGDLGLNWDGGYVNYNEFFHNGVDAVEGILWWRDSWTNAANDYDLVLFRWDPNLRGGRGDWISVNLGGQGEEIQWGRSGDQPEEEVYVPGGLLPAGWYSWAIVNMRPWAQTAVTGQHGYLPANNKAVDFDFFCPNHDLAVNRPYRSIMTPADNESSGFMAAAAISAQFETGGMLGRPGLGIQEVYSSEGPNQNGFIAPEISAPDDTSNYVAQTSGGFGPTFRGTSASAPHLAGVAALVAAANPSFLGPQIENYIKTNAIGLGDPGPDRKTGWGSANLPATRTVDLARLAGASRYQTALAISGGWASGSATSVVLASGANFPDALAGGSLAGAFDCPILLTPPTGTFPELLTELHRLTSGAPNPTVYILGSTAAVSSTVANQLTASGFTVIRKGGATRYETAAGIARTSLDKRPTDTAFIVTGGNFPDALAVAPIAYRQGFPVLPVYVGSIPSAVEAVITQRGIKHAIIAGSTGVVGNAVQTRLGQLGVTTIERWQGATRYDTMRDVVDKSYAKGWVDFGHVGIASGANFPDALSGAADAGIAGGPVLLTVPNILGGQAMNAIGDHAAEVSTVHVYGGEPALQGAVVLGARMRSDH